MGIAMWVSDGVAKEIVESRRGARSVPRPLSGFGEMPRFRPPDMDDPGNPDHLWLVCDEWMSPPVEGVSVCVRAPVVVGDRVFGFFSDGISVPQLAWSVFGMHPFSMPELCGALGHDIAYSAELADRRTCDAWMRSWLAVAKVGRMRRGVIYGCLRSFGGIVWGRHTPGSVEAARLMCRLVVEGGQVEWPEWPATA